MGSLAVCPNCKAIVRAEALTCGHCRRPLPNQTHSPQADQSIAPAKRSIGPKIAAAIAIGCLGVPLVLCVGLGAIGSLLPAAKNAEQSGACSNAIQRVKDFRPQNGKTTLVRGISTLLVVSKYDNNPIEVIGWSVREQGRYCLVSFEIREKGTEKEMQWLLDPSTGVVMPNNELARVTTSAIY
ncbi:MAG: hypothetical protein ACKVXR_15500 [Planctomycetota bacterium]